VGFYQWHLADPIMYRVDLASRSSRSGDVLRQGQEGGMAIPPHESAAAYWRTGDRTAVGRAEARRAGRRLLRHLVRVLPPRPARPRLDIAMVLADITRLDYEEPNEIEGFIASMS
jgi:hypothetical protein